MGFWPPAQGCEERATLGSCRRVAQPQRGCGPAGGQKDQSQFAKWSAGVAARSGFTLARIPDYSRHSFLTYALRARALALRRAVLHSARTQCRNPVGVEEFSAGYPGHLVPRNPGLEDAIPLGLKEPNVPLRSDDSRARRAAFTPLQRTARRERSSQPAPSFHADAEAA